MASISTAAILAEELQPIFAKTARERGNAGRLLAPPIPTNRRNSTQLIMDDDFVIDDQDQARNVTKPVDEDAPITGGRLVFSSFDVKQKRYGPGEITLSDDLREDMEDAGVPLDMLAARKLARGADDIHHYHVMNALQNTGLYRAGCQTAIGNVNNEAIGLGKLLEDALLAVEAEGGSISHVVMNRKTAFALNRCNDVAGKNKTAISAKPGSGQLTLGYEGPARFAEWLKGNFEAELVIPRRQKKVSGVREFMFGGYIAIVLADSGPGEPSFLKTFAKRTPGIPNSETDLGVIKRYNVANPDVEKLYAELKFSVAQPYSDSDGLVSPHGYLFTGVTYSG